LLARATRRGSFRSVPGWRLTGGISPVHFQIEASMSADRNLLFGVLALQMDFIDREQLVKGMSDWAINKQKSLGEILVANGAMSDGDRIMLAPMVDRHIELHENDSAKSLAVISSVESLKQELRDISETEVTLSGQSKSISAGSRSDRRIGTSGNRACLRGWAIF
jgi:hypothetical protein